MRHHLQIQDDDVDGELTIGLGRCTQGHELRGAFPCSKSAVRIPDVYLHPSSRVEIAHGPHSHAWFPWHLSLSRRDPCGVTLSLSVCVCV
jgi:hypothetical protein